MRCLLLASLVCLSSSSAIAADWQLSGYVETPAVTRDASHLSRENRHAANLNRFGFYSDLTYDARTGKWFALSDRGPGGGLIDYSTRVQRLRIPYDPITGAISDPVIDKTILFKTADGDAFNGLNPLLLNGRSDKLGLSFDPEGVAIGSQGNFYIADEYGPSIYEFSSNGQFIRAFASPQNLLPRTATGASELVDGRPTIVNGRQDNRGFEGITLNASRTRLYAVMQDPLVDEGDRKEGRRSRNVRIVAFDVRSGEAVAQYAYQLESIATLNAIDPATSDDFSATQQGRSIGLSAIHALSDREFLVLERDNRGLGVDVTAPPLHKRIYRISLEGATDVSAISFANSNALPAGVVAVSKSAEVDLIAQLRAVGAQDIPEKLEGLAIGPRLTDGRYLVLVGSDNDYSVTQTGSGEQFEVCINRSTGARVSDIPLDRRCPAGMARIPGFLLAFAVDFGG